MNQLFKKLHRQYISARLSDIERFAQGELPLPSLDFIVEQSMYDQNAGMAMEAKSARIIRPTIEQEIDSEIAHLTSQLEKKKKLKQLLVDNPAIAEFMNLSRS